MDWINKYTEISNKIILGKSHELKLALACILADGHLLIEDIPGVGKTTIVKFISKVLGLEMSRIQFTNDLLPSDILGVNVFNSQKQSFIFHKGAIFGQLILADELNRASPKTQSALLQVMEEKRLTVDGVTYELPNPFIVMATQNPRSQIGTNPLPESQLDRFLMKIQIGYPDRESESELLLGDERASIIEEVDSVFNDKNELSAYQNQVSEVIASKAIANYIVDILDETRINKDYYALSPRAGLDLIRAAKAWAFIEGRKAVEPEDIQAVAGSVLGHRVISNLYSSVTLEKDVTQKLINTIHVY